jgi:ATP-binding protein involved in chromosome partitioning
MPGKVKNLILIASGKGGVGKSTVATNIAMALVQRGFATGLLDADIYGPSIPTMLGKAERPESTDGTTIMPIERFGLKLMSMGYMVDPNVAMVWRGPMLASAVTQFVNDVDWGDLDYLIFDLPPGTGDIQLSLAQKVPVTGAVLVTTPQDVALADVYRAKAMFDKVRIPVLGMVENMSWFLCGECGTEHPIFAKGGGEKAATALDLPFFGGIPIESQIRECGDQGEPIVSAFPESDSTKAFHHVTEALVESVKKANKEKAAEEEQKGRLRIITQ